MNFHNNLPNPDFDKDTFSCVIKSALRKVILPLIFSPKNVKHEDNKKLTRVIFADLKCVDIPVCGSVTDLLQMISCDDVGVGSSRSWLWERLSERRCIRPQGTTDGNELRQLWDRSRTVIRDDTSMNQSRFNQGSFSPDQSTWTACGWGTWNCGIFLTPS